MAEQRDGVGGRFRQRLFDLRDSQDNPSETSRGLRVEVDFSALMDVLTMGHDAGVPAEQLACLQSKIAFCDRHGSKVVMLDLADAKAIAQPQSRGQQ